MLDCESLDGEVTSTPRLSFLWLEITPKCNLECIHCYSDSSPARELTGTMTVAGWQRVLLEAAELDCRRVQFIGGEPTLHPHLPELLTFAKSCDYQYIEVFSNATRLSAEMETALVKTNSAIATSFYSNRPETHDAITRRNGSFERTAKSIRRLKEVGIPIRAGVIETHLNRGHAEAASRHLRNLGVHEISVDSSRAVGRGASEEKPASPFETLCGQCWSGRLCITAAGRAYPCVFSRFADLGSASDGIAAILASDAMHKFRQANRTHFGPETNCPPINCTPTCSPAYQFCSPSVSPVRCAPGSDSPKNPTRPENP